MAKDIIEEMKKEINKELGEGIEANRHFWFKKLEQALASQKLDNEYQRLRGFEEGFKKAQANWKKEIDDSIRVNKQRLDKEIRDVVIDELERLLKKL